MDDFSNLHVVVTGGTGALGAAVVGRLLGAGAWCHVPVFNRAELDDFAHAGHARVSIAEGVDLRDESHAEGFYADLPSLWASLHTAGGFAMAPIAQISLEDFRAQLDMNLTTCFLCCREAVKKIRASAARRGDSASGARDGAGAGSGGGGRIVNVAARPALVPAGGMAAYTTAKAGVASLTQCLAEELAPEGIWVNAVAPSILDTPANRRAMAKADFAKWPKVDEVAEAMVFLASPRNRVTRGAIVTAYGWS